MRSCPMIDQARLRTAIDVVFTALARWKVSISGQLDDVLLTRAVPRTIGVTSL